MAVNSCQEEQDSYKIAVMLDQSTTIPPCETKISLLNGLEVTQPLERSLSLNAVFSGQNKVKGNMGNVDVNFPCIAAADLEKGRSEKPKTKTETVGNGTIENPSTKTMQRQISIQMGEKIMQMLMDKNLVLPKFDFRDKTVPERVHDMPNNRLRKYKRSASFNSRKVVLLFSVLSSLGTMILIFLTLRVRQLANGSLHG